MNLRKGAARIQKTTITTYSFYEGLVVNDGPHDVFLNNHDLDFDPGSDSSSHDADCAQVDKAESANNNADADDDEESNDNESYGLLLATNIRCDGTGYLLAHNREKIIICSHITHYILIIIKVYFIIVHDNIHG